MNKDGESSKKILLFVSMLFMLSFGLITVGYINSGKKTDELSSVLMDGKHPKNTIHNVNNDLSKDHSQQDLLTGESSVGSEQVVPSTVDPKKLVSPDADVKVKVVDYEIEINDIFKDIPIKKELVSDFKKIKSLLEERGKKDLKIIDRDLVIKKSTIEYIVDCLKEMRSHIISILDSTTDDITFDKIMNIELLIVNIFDYRDKIHVVLESYDGKKDITTDEIEIFDCSVKDYIHVHSTELYDELKKKFYTYMSYLYTYYNRHIFNMLVKHKIISFKINISLTNSIINREDKNLYKQSNIEYRQNLKEFNKKYIDIKYFSCMDDFEKIDIKNPNKKYLDEFMTKLKDDKDLFLDGYNKLVEKEKEYERKRKDKKLSKIFSSKNGDQTPMEILKDVIAKNNVGIFDSNIKDYDIKMIDLFINLLDVYDKLYCHDKMKVKPEGYVKDIKFEDMHFYLIYKFIVTKMKVKFIKFVKDLYSKDSSLDKVKKEIEHKLDEIVIDSDLPIKSNVVDLLEKDYDTKLKIYWETRLKRKFEDDEVQKLKACLFY